MCSFLCDFCFSFAMLGWYNTFITVKWQLNTCSRLFDSFCSRTTVWPYHAQAGLTIYLQHIDVCVVCCTGNIYHPGNVHGKREANVWNILLLRFTTHAIHSMHTANDVLHLFQSLQSNKISTSMLKWLWEWNFCIATTVYAKNIQCGFKLNLSRYLSVNCSRATRIDEQKCIGTSKLTHKGDQSIWKILSAKTQRVIFHIMYKHKINNNHNKHICLVLMQSIILGQKCIKVWSEKNVSLIG